MPVNFEQALMVFLIAIGIGGGLVSLISKTEHPVLSILMIVGGFVMWWIYSIDRSQNQ